MSPILDSLIDAMRHPLYGERFTGLVAQYWPVTWALLREGLNGQGNGLYRVRTDSVYWLCGWYFEDASAARRVKDCRRVVGQSLEEIFGFPGNMPGLEALEEKSDTFKRDIDRADAVLGVVSKVVGIIGAIANMAAGGQ